LKILAVGLCFCISAGSTLAQDIAPEKAHQYGQAYGAVLGFVKSMDYVSASCGGDAKDLTAAWEARNSKQKAQAETLLRRFISQLAKQYGQKAADTAEAQLHQQVNQVQTEAAKKSFAQLASLPVNQKAFVCKKFIASVHSGEWDIATKNPALYKYLATETP
jgi:glycerol-3-phosphate dehydrogenase